jgi:hypothetical protein
MEIIDYFGTKEVSAVGSQGEATPESSSPLFPGENLRRLELIVFVIPPVRRGLGRIAANHPLLAGGA